MSSKSKTVLSLILNLTVAVVTTGIVISYFFVESPIRTDGWDSFRFFTTDSNVLAAIAAVIVAVYDIKILRKKIDKIPHVVIVFKYIASVGMALTFSTVMAFLIPVYGPALLLGETGFHMHVFAPLATIFSIMLLEKHSRIAFAESLLGMLPIVTYGAVYFTEVLLITEQNGGWSDFYAFNLGGYWYITLSAMLTVSFLLSQLIRLLHNRSIPKPKK